MRVVTLLAVVALVACGTHSTTAASPSPHASPSLSPTPIESPSPSPAPSPSPLVTPSPAAAVPSWAAIQATCTGSPTAQEALLTLHGASNIVLADVSNAQQPHTLCTLAGSGSPQLATQRMVSWSATQGSPGTTGVSVIATLDIFSGISALVASWQGGGFLDGLHAWSPDEGSLAYVTSDSTAVNVHVLSGAGDRVVANLGAVPGRGVNPSEDDAFLGYSADGQFFAFVQTFTSNGDQLQVRRATDGSLAYSQATGTMASWSSTGSRLFFRQTNTNVIEVWDPTAGVSQGIGQLLAWIRPRADSGDDYLAFTVRDTAGTPYVWLYGHSGHAGGRLANVRSSPVFINTATVFYVEEASCGSTCGPGPPTQPDGHTFTYDISRQAESASTIVSVLGSWPRVGQSSG